MSSGILRDQMSHPDCVSSDMCPAGVGSASSYSRVTDVDQSLKVPLGSQLQLLTSQYAGDPYFNYQMVNYKLLPPSLVGTSSYNALVGNGKSSCSNGTGQFFTFGCAYQTY